MISEKWPKYLGSFTLQYLDDRCESACYIGLMQYLYIKGEKLTVIAEKPQIEFFVNNSRKITSHINSDRLNVALMTETKQYFSDIEHFYGEIWNFLLFQNYVELQPMVINYISSTYTVQFDVFMQKQVLNIEQIHDKDLNYKMAKKDDLEQQKEYKEALYRKEVQKYAKQSFVILCELLKIRKNITALIVPFEPTQLLDDLIINKYKSKPFHQKLYIAKNLRIPQLHIKDMKYNSYYQVQCDNQQIQSQAPKLSQENFDKINSFMLSDQSGEQEVEGQIQSTQQYFFKLKSLQQANENKEVDILSINEEKSKRFYFAKQPQLLKSTLFPYQQQGLQWMLYRENIISENQLYNNDLLRQELGDRRLNKMWSQLELLDQDLIYLNEFTGEISDKFLEFKESYGGIVADQMGLGKTLLSIALILKTQEIQHEYDEFLMTSKKQKYDKGKTLLVVQLSVFGHWINEFQRHTVGNSVSVYETAYKLDLGVYDVVITTYGILSRDFAQDGLIFKYQWLRVILDEAHTIKGKGTLCAKASYHIPTNIRWCLTGTPLQNQLDDLFSLFHFLKIEIFSDYFWYNTYMNKQKNRQQVYQLLHKILEPILLRRTKTSTYQDGKIMLILPLKRHDIIKVKLSDQENEIYRAFYDRTTKEFKYLLEQKILKKSFFHIFSIITFLRQLCDSPFLYLQTQQYKLNGVKQQRLQKLSQTIDNFFARKKQKVIQSHQNQVQQVSHSDNSQIENEDEENDFEQSESFEQEQQQQIQNPILNNQKYQQEIKFKIKNNQIKKEDCVICCEQMTENIALFSCGHCVDYQCFVAMYNNNKLACRCPLCKIKLNYSTDVKHIYKKTIQQFYKTDATQISSKFLAILEEIQKIIQKQQKVVIYTQWIKVMNFFQSQLMIRGIEYKRLDGSMSKDQRQKNIDLFQTTSCSVFLVSLKAGAYGINLSSANNVILVDPWWNPAVEEQAIERIHRLGQVNPVYIKSFICEGTIEERVLELQEIKKKLFQDALHLRPAEIELDAMEQLNYILS